MIPKSRERHRLQFDFSAEAYERLNAIKEQTDASSYAELVRNALRVYEWIMEQEKQGYEVGLLKDNKPVKSVKLIY